MAVEIWVKVGDEKKKFQGSFRKVMEDILKEGQGKEVALLSFHADQKQRRRLKRELRAAGKDLLKAAERITEWFKAIERRRLKRRINLLRKRARYTSKGDTLYCPKLLEEVKALEEKLKELN